jgi:hypothetical protein
VAGPDGLDLRLCRGDWAAANRTGELGHERDNLDVEQIQAAEFGGELRGLAFVFSVGRWRLYISPNNFHSATSHGDHEVRIRLDGADVRIRDEFWGQFEREGSG